MVRTKGDPSDYEKGAFHTPSNSSSIDSKVSPVNTVDGKPKTQNGIV